MDERDGSPDAAAAGLAQAPIVLVGSRRKAVRIAVFSTLFVAVGLWEARQPGTWHGLPVVAVGVGALALGVAGLAAAVVQLFRPPVLTLSRSGLALETFNRSLSMRWDEIERFQAWRPASRGAPMVGYMRRGPPRSAMGTVARGLGCDGAIPDHFPIPPPALLRLCEACLRRWG